MGRLLLRIKLLLRRRLPAQDDLLEEERPLVFLLLGALKLTPLRANTNASSSALLLVALNEEPDLSLADLSLADFELVDLSLADLELVDLSLLLLRVLVVVCVVVVVVVNTRVEGLF